MSAIRLRMVTDEFVDFTSEPIYDAILRTWTYKVWEIKIVTSEGKCRMHEYWCDCTEDGEYIRVGEVYEYRYFDSMARAMADIKDSVYA